MKKLITLAIVSILSMAAHADTFIGTLSSGAMLTLDTVKKCPGNPKNIGVFISKDLKRKETICWSYLKETKMVAVTYADGSYKEFPEKMFKNSKEQDDENQGD